MSLKAHITRALRARGEQPAPWSGWNGYTAFTATYRVERDESGQLQKYAQPLKFYVGDNGTIKLGANFNTSMRLKASKVVYLVQEGARLLEQEQNVS